MESLKQKFDKALNELDSIIEHMRKRREELVKKFEREYARLLHMQSINLEEMKDFLEEPYCILPKDRNAFFVVVPKFVNMAVGWLYHQTRSFNIFVVNRYMQWIMPLPPSIKEKLQIKEMPQLKVVDGYLITGKENIDHAWRQYRRFLYARKGDRIRIKRGYEFHLIARLIEDGILPFIPRPVEEGDIRSWHGIKLRSYQVKWWKEFIGKGAVGIFAPFGSGKSLFGVYALARIKGRKLVVVPTITLKEQWLERIAEYISQYMDEIEVVTYHAYEKVRDKEWTLTIFDECQHLPANTYIRLSTIKTKYRIGLSGSPYREDGRESYIFALTGFPVGVDWGYFISKGIVREPTFKVYIVPNERAKLNLVEELIKIPAKTVIFCDWLDLGEKIAKRLGVPFVHGKTKDRMKILKENQIVVVSRVGDEGVSLPEIERVIEVAFLYGSRMQESQRFGRLMHSKKERSEHMIVMTDEEFQRYHKRLYSIIEKGFKMEIIRY